MELILAAATCSVIVSIFLKWFKSHGYVPMQMITANYAVASVLAYLWFKPDLAHISIAKTPWWLIIVLGIVLPSVFLCLSKSLQTAGIVKTEIAQRLSVVLSLCAAYFLFQEQFSNLKILGIGLGLVAVICILFSHTTGFGLSKSSRQGQFYVLSVWVGYALVDILLKYTSSLGLQFAVSLNLMFIAALIFSVLYLFMQKVHWHIQSLAAGLLLGLFNFANIALYVKAHVMLKDSPAVVFAGMNFMVIMLGVVAGLVLFKEKIKIITVLGLILGLAGLSCLAIAI